MHVKLRLGLMTGASVAIFIVVSATSFFGVANLIDDQQWLAHTRIVIGEYRNMLFHLTSAASDERSYLLTGEQDFFNDYRGQSELTLESLDVLKDLVKDNPKQRDTVKEMTSLVERGLKSFDETLEVAQREGREAANKRVRSEQLSIMQKVQLLEREFEEEEYRLEKSRGETVMHSVKSAEWCLIAGCLLSIAFVAVFNYYFGRHIITCIRQLLNAAENAESGRFSKIVLDANDEFGELGEAFNQLGLSLDNAKRKLKKLEADCVEMAELRPIVGPLDQANKINSQVAEFAEGIRQPVDGAITRSGTIFRNTGEVRRLLNTTDKNLASLKQSIEECSEHADKLAGLQSELDNISNALEVISMSVDMTAPDGQPVLGAVMTRLHELSERCHKQRQVIGESFTRLQTLLSRAMLTTHASSGAESTGRQLLDGLTDTIDGLVRELEACRASSNLVIESVATQAELLASCTTVVNKIASTHPVPSGEVVKKLQTALDQTQPHQAV